MHIKVIFVYYCIVLEINFEEPAYRLREGDPQLPPIRLLFRRTQSPITVSLFPVSITEAIDPAGFNMGDFIPSGISEATPGTNVLSQHAVQLMYTDVVNCL